MRKNAKNYKKCANIWDFREIRENAENLRKNEANYKIQVNATNTAKLQQNKEEGSPHAAACGKMRFVFLIRKNMGNPRKIEAKYKIQVNATNTPKLKQNQEEGSPHAAACGKMLKQSKNTQTYGKSWKSAKMRNIREKMRQNTKYKSMRQIRKN